MSEDALRHLGNEAFKEKRYHKAIHYYTESLLTNLDPLVLGNRAQAHINLSQWNSALVDCNRAIYLKNDSAKLFFRRAIVFEKLQLFQLAEADAERALSLSEDSAIKGLVTRVKGKKNVEVLFVTPIELGDEIRSDENLITYDIVFTSCSSVNVEDVEIIKEEKTHIVCDTDIPRVPDSFPIFLSHFEYLKKNESVFAKYFLKIPFSIYSKIFDDLLDTEILSTLLRGLLHIIQNQTITNEFLITVGDCLLRLTSIERFDMATMFLNSEDKKCLYAICDQLPIMDPKTLTSKYC